MNTWLAKKAEKNGTHSKLRIVLRVQRTACCQAYYWTGSKGRNTLYDMFARTTLVVSRVLASSLHRDASQALIARAAPGQGGLVLHKNTRPCGGLAHFAHLLQCTGYVTDINMVVKFCGI